MYRGLMATLVAPFILTACGDGLVGSRQDLPLEGSYTATEVVRTDGTELIRAGWVAGLRVVPGDDATFRLALVPPAVEFAAPTVRGGYVEAAPDGLLSFYSQGFNLLDDATVQREGTAVLLRFQHGGLDLTTLRLVPATGLDPAALNGTFSAQRFIVRTAGGAPVELVEHGATVELEFQSNAGSYRLTGIFPAGTLADARVELDQNGVFDTTGPALVLAGAFGCPEFAASAALANRLVVQGLACSLAGQPAVVEAEFNRL